MHPGVSILPGDKVFCYRFFVRETQENQVSQVELFLNSVPILAPLTKEERMRLVDALEEVTYQAGKLTNVFLMAGLFLYWG